MKRMLLIGMLSWVMSLGMAQTDACQKGWKQLFLRSRQLHELQADFVQTRTVAVLNTPDVQTGHLSYKAPHTIRWTYSGADPNAATSPQVTSIVQTWLKGETGALDKSFTQDCAQHEGDRWLRLVPKDRRLKPYIEYILLKINTRGDVIEIFVQEKSGDNTHVRMHHMKFY